MGLFPVYNCQERQKATNMSLVIPTNFQHILRVMNTNIDGKRNIMFAITAIKGICRRYANIVLKKADIDLSKRAGELSEEEVEKIITIMSNPRQYKIPDWFLNRQKDIKDGKTGQKCPTCLTTSFVKIWSALRRSVLTEVCDTIGVFVYVVSTPKPLVVVDELLVYQRRNKCNKPMDLYVRNTQCCMRINSDKMKKK